MPDETVMKECAGVRLLRIAHRRITFGDYFAVTSPRATAKRVTMDLAEATRLFDEEVAASRACPLVGRRIED